MPSTPDLHTRLLAEIERREQVARAATAGPWRTNTYGIEFEAWSVGEHHAVGRTFEVTPGTRRLADTRHIALHDPADALRRYAHYRKVLERHASDDGRYCDRELSDGSAHADWPCDDIRDLAEALGISLATPDTTGTEEGA